jgi:7-cyano-7-deazaguanine synthase
VIYFLFKKWDSTSLMKKRAIVLLSGGLDSATVLEVAKAEGFDVFTLTIDYGQRHSVELAAVQKILLGSPVTQQLSMKVDLRAWGGSALTSQIAVPKSDSVPLTSEVPSTYVPARNTIFLSLALAFAETIQAFDIFIGGNRMDGVNYPDCTPEYIAAFEKMANLATGASRDEKKKFRLHAPLIQLDKWEIIQLGLKLGVNYSLTTSCYDPSPEGIACGRCHACHLRLEGFRSVKIQDPIRYQSV